MMDCVLSVAIHCCFGYCPRRPQTIKAYCEFHKECKESNGSTTHIQIDVFKENKLLKSQLSFYKAKFDYANKVLDDFETESKKYPQPQDMNFRLPCDVYWNLRNALNIGPLRSFTSSTESGDNREREA